MKSNILNYSAIIVAIIGGLSGLISALVPGIIPILFEMNGYLAIEAEPENVEVSFLNYSGNFSQGMALKPGIYHINITADGYKPQKALVSISQNKKVLFKTKLEKSFEAEKIALDFYETDIKNVFRIISEVSGKNFVISPLVRGRVTITMHEPLPWNTFMNNILKMNRLTAIMDGEFIRVLTIDEYKKEKEERKIIQNQEIIQMD